MKVTEMTSKQYQVFSILLELRRRLRFVELDKLELKFLDPLRDEVAARLEKDYNIRPEVG